MNFVSTAHNSLKVKIQCHWSLLLIITMWELFELKLSIRTKLRLLPAYSLTTLDFKTNLASLYVVIYSLSSSLENSLSIYRMDLKCYAGKITPCIEWDICFNLFSINLEMHVWENQLHILKIAFISQIGAQKKKNHTS